MSQNTDPFPTPRGALSPDGVTAAVPLRICGAYGPRPPLYCTNPLGHEGKHACITETREVWERQGDTSLGVPGYAGAKGAVPEPQEPTTEAGREYLAALSADTWSSEGRMRWARRFVLAIEAEARAAAPPDIDVERLAKAIWGLSDRDVLRIDADSPKELSDLAEIVAAEYRRLASLAESGR